MINREPGHQHILNPAKTVADNPFAPKIPPAPPTPPPPGPRTVTAEAPEKPAFPKEVD